MQSKVDKWIKRCFFIKLKSISFLVNSCIAEKCKKHNTLFWKASLIYVNIQFPYTFTCKLIYRKHCLVWSNHIVIFLFQRSLNGKLQTTKYGVNDDVCNKNLCFQTKFLQSKTVKRLLTLFLSLWKSNKNIWTSVMWNVGHGL